MPAASNRDTLRLVTLPSREEHTAKVPKTQRAAVATAHGRPLEIRDSEPVRQPSADEVLVHIVRTGVCHTDLHAMSGDWEVKSKMPLIAGHEGAGYIVAVGNDVTTMKDGDRVGVKWLGNTCAACEYCLSGRETVCPNQQRTGFDIDGTFQEYAVAKAAQVVPIPKEVSYEQAASILCAGVTTYKGLKESEVKPGQWIVISGAGGGLGHLAVQYAKAMGMRVIGIDAGSKSEFCNKLGCDQFFDFKDKDVAESILEVTGGGAHGALLAVAIPEPYEQAISYLRPWGTLVTLGLPKKGSIIPADIFTIVMQRLTIRGSIVGTRTDAIEALGFAAKGLVKVHLETRGLSEVKDVLEKMEKGEISGRIVLDTAQ
ncbi:alcohol dehydrogenase [Geranomyces michiganensis]|nr:alcohol dehydrogenase [Geranomyces michiganensis]